ncbi:type IV secretion system protein [Ruegeria sp.]|uniref:type IV secretion system protein n=1 Tax=Ruegeria sp. TaxID=1879320 RepID=UPI003B009225
MAQTGPKHALLRALLHISLALAVLTLIAPVSAEANQVDEIRDAFETSVVEVGDRIKGIAIRLLFSLFVIELVWSLGRIVMEQGDIGQVLSALMRRIVIAGFFLLLIDGIPSGGGETLGIADFILRSAEALSDEAGGPETLSPSDIFFPMMDTGFNIWDNSTGIGGTLSAAIVWVMMVVMGAIMTGLIILAYVMIYITFTLGILILGFGILQPTQHFATNFIFRAIGSIFRLFATLLIAAIIKTQLESMEGLNGFEDGILIIGLCLILTMVLFVVPASIESLIAGAPGASPDGAIHRAGTKGAGLAGQGAKTAGKAGAKAAGTTLKAGSKAAGGALSASIRSIKGRFGK